VTDETPTPEDETPRDEEQAAESAAPQDAADAPEPTAAAEPEEPTAEAEADESAAPAEEPVAEADEPAAAAEDEADDEEETPRAKPAIPGADLEVDIVEEGADPLADRDLEAEAAAAAEAAAEEEAQQPIASVAIDLAADARYRATGKRKTAVARVILKPGTGVYEINGKTLVDYFPRATLQRNISQPLEAVGFEERMDVIARMHGGGVSAQAGALRHGISRALLEADPNLRGELKKRGFLTRDARAKERKKAGLKKARKRPQFSKR
jgi:small subunit ribosomal protein S9